MGRPWVWNPVQKTCARCRKTFVAKQRYGVLHQRFCGLKCSALARNASRHVSWTCTVCGKKKKLSPAKAALRKFCSRACVGAAQVTSGKHASWRAKRAARERDVFKCRVKGCPNGGKGKDTHAHHIIPRNVGGSDDLSNLVTVCSSCHRKVEHDLFMQIIALLPKAVTQRVVDDLYAFQRKGALLG